MKEQRGEDKKARVMRKRVILAGLLAVVGGVVLTVALWTFSSRGDPDAAADRVSQWHGLRLYEGEDAERVWVEIEPGRRLSARVVLLVHGLDEPGSIWDQLAPALADAAHETVRFEYPNDQAIADSAELLDAALRRLHDLGVERVSVVAHSMGGLVARDALTRKAFLEHEPEGLAAVDRLIAIGTPHEGSPWAGMRWAAELREQAERLMGEASPEAEDLYRFSFDGNGEAGADLQSGSAFLTELNARPAPEGVETTCLVGQMISLPTGSRAEMVGLAKRLGDGVVPVSSAELDGCEDIVYLSANHRAMIRSLPLSNGGAPPPGIEIVLDRLDGTQSP